jgi:hypothetical protein
MLKTGLLLAALGSFSPPESTQAIPHVYTNLVLGIDSAETCIQNSKRVASKNGFTENQEVLGEKGSQFFYADHRDKPLALAISCSTKLGGASIAVTGMNNDDTFAMFERVYDDF